MSQTYVYNKVVPALKFAVPPKMLRLRTPDGPMGRLKMLRHVVNELVKLERVEVEWQLGSEARQYAERLISDAVRHGPCHRPTMECADFWLQDKTCIHKLFKVLLPRYQNDGQTSPAYTNMARAPSKYPDYLPGRGILELRGNPFPALVHRVQGEYGNKDLIHNVLLAEIRREKKRMMAAAEATPEVAPKV